LRAFAGDAKRSEFAGFCRKTVAASGWIWAWHWRIVPL